MGARDVEDNRGRGFGCRAHDALSGAFPGDVARRAALLPVDGLAIDLEERVHLVVRPAAARAYLGPERADVTRRAHILVVAHVSDGVGWPSEAAAMPRSPAGSGCPRPSYTTLPTSTTNSGCKPVSMIFRLNAAGFPHLTEKRCAAIVHTGASFSEPNRLWYAVISVNHRTTRSSDHRGALVDAIRSVAAVWPM